MPVMVRYCVLDFLRMPMYRVGTDGSVWSQHNNKWGVGAWKRLKPLINVRHGTVSVALRKDGKYLWIKIAHLVLTAFIGPKPEGMEACHFPDRNPANNHLKNLRWDTHTGNEADKALHGTKTFGERNGYTTLTNEKVLEMRKLRRERGTSHKLLSQLFGVHVNTVSNVLNYKTWPHVA